MKHLKWFPIPDGLCAGDGRRFSVLLTNEEHDPRWRYTIAFMSGSSSSVANTGASPTLNDALVAIDQYLSTTYVYRTL